MVPSPDPALHGVIKTYVAESNVVQLNFESAAPRSAMMMGTITDGPRAIEANEIGVRYFRYVAESEPPPRPDAGSPEYVDAADADASLGACKDSLGAIRAYASADEVIAVVTAHDWLKCKSSTLPGVDGFRFGTDGRYRSLRFDASGALVLGEKAGTFAVTANAARWHFRLTGVDGTTIEFDTDLHDPPPVDAASAPPMTMDTDYIGIHARFTAL